MSHFIPTTPNILDEQTLVLVPVKTLAFAKSRLSTILTTSQRFTLALNLLTNSVTVLRAVFANVALLTADPLVTKLATELGATALPEEFNGSPDNANLNRSLQQTLQDLELGLTIERLLLLPADLPFLNQADLSMLLSLDQGQNAVIVPDKERQGTNGLLLPVGYARSFEFCFGDNSFRLHLEKIRQLAVPYQICPLPGLTFDLDNPTDFASLPTSLQQTLLNTLDQHLYTKISTFSS